MPLKLSCSKRACLQSDFIASNQSYCQSPTHSVENELDYDMLIGMDIILLGDFCLTNKDGKSVFSFRIPSKEHIKLTE